MQCAFCKEVIDDDSFFCDMCGEEIKTCPVCKKPGKGKVCTTCGKALAIAKSQAEPALMNAPANGTPISSSCVTEIQESSDSATGTHRLPDNEPAKSVMPQLQLFNKNINIDLKINDDSILGRTIGQYVSTFAGFNQISGKHCRFNYDRVKGWCVTDLGSTNKTRYNNQELVPNMPQVLSDQSYIKIANIEFFVRIIPG